MNNRCGPEKARILINHWRWLEANGYKQQAASFKQQASSSKLDTGSRLCYYRIIKEKDYGQ